MFSGSRPCNPHHSRGMRLNGAPKVFMVREKSKMSERKARHWPGPQNRQTRILLFLPVLTTGSCVESRGREMLWERRRFEDERLSPSVSISLSSALPHCLCLSPPVSISLSPSLSLCLSLSLSPAPQTDVRTHFWSHALLFHTISLNPTLDSNHFNSVH